MHWSFEECSVSFFSWVNWKVLHSGKILERLLSQQRIKFWYSATMWRFIFAITGILPVRLHQRLMVPVGYTDGTPCWWPVCQIGLLAAYHTLQICLHHGCQIGLLAPYHALQICLHHGKPMEVRWHEVQAEIWASWNIHSRSFYNGVQKPSGRSATLFVCVTVKSDVLLGHETFQAYILCNTFQLYLVMRNCIQRGKTCKKKQQQKQCTLGSLAALQCPILRALRRVVSAPDFFCAGVVYLCSCDREGELALFGALRTRLHCFVAGFVAHVCVWLIPIWWLVYLCLQYM